jgi:hypothetical protein
VAGAGDHLEPADTIGQRVGHPARSGNGVTESRSPTLSNVGHSMRAN